MHLRAVAFVSAALFTACSRPGTPPPPRVPTVTQEVGSEGGTVSLPGGATVVIPPGALATRTPITLTERVRPAPPGTTYAGPGFEFTPNVAFSTMVTITLPWDPSSKPTSDPDAHVIVFRDDGSGPVPWPSQEVDAAHLAIQTAHFSSYQPYVFTVRDCLPFETDYYPPTPSVVTLTVTSVPGAGPPGVTREVSCEGLPDPMPGVGPGSIACACLENGQPIGQPTGKGYRTVVHFPLTEAWIYMMVCGWSCQAEAPSALCGGVPLSSGNICCADGTQAVSCPTDTCGGVPLLPGNVCCADGTQAASCPAASTCGGSLLAPGNVCCADGTQAASCPETVVSCFVANTDQCFEEGAVAPSVHSMDASCGGISGAVYSQGPCPPSAAFSCIDPGSDATWWWKSVYYPPQWTAADAASMCTP